MCSNNTLIGSSWTWPAGHILPIPDLRTVPYTLKKCLLNKLSSFNVSPLHVYIYTLSFQLTAVPHLLFTAAPFCRWRNRGLTPDLHVKTCTQIFTAVLFIVAKMWKESNCPSNDKWINKMCYSHMLEYDLPVKGMKHWYMLQYRWILKTLC